LDNLKAAQFFSTSSGVNGVSKSQLRLDL